MSPILGIWASQITGRLWEPQGAYESISTVTVGAGGSASISFSSIPSTYKHLQIRAIARITNADKNLNISINGDTTSTNYSAHVLYGDGAAATSTYYANNQQVSWIPSSAQTANVFGGSVIDILDYTSTNKYKTIRSLSCYDENGAGFIWFESNLWRNTAAITAITLSNPYYNIAQYSHFALYGIRG